VLASLLPGLRDLRNPLTAGLLLLATLYVLLASSVERVHEQARIGDGLQSLSDRLGERGWTVIAAVVAYLLGSIYLTVSRRWLRNLALRQLPRLTTETSVDDDKPSPLEVLRAPFSRTSVRRLGLLRGDHYDRVTAQNVCVEILFSGGHRLLGVNKDLYDQYDRLKAEAEFRDAVAAPALLFVVVALFDLRLGLAGEGTIVVLASIASYLLFSQARRLDREANSMYAHSIADGLISSPYLDDPLKYGRTRWVVKSNPAPSAAPATASPGPTAPGSREAGGGGARRR
jgi:hypothetical protein